MAAVLFIVNFVIFYQPKVSAIEDKCQSVVLVHARGSGQAEGAITAITLQDKVDSSLGGSSESVAYYELSSNMPGVTKDYPAVGVGFTDGNGNFSIGNMANAVNSDISLVEDKAPWLSWARVGSYRDSVRQGEELLFEFLNSGQNQTIICSNTKFVFAGYSQGAHVIGEALADERMNRFYDKILFVAFFGDPKHNPYTSSASADGIGGANWIRGDARDYTAKGGLLEARYPYLPQEIVAKKKAGSWCRKNDPICTGDVHYLLSPDSHMEYHQREVGQAADEIAATIKDHLVKSGNAPNLPVCGAVRQDIVLAIDLSPTMRRHNDLFGSDASEARYTAERVFATGCSVRIAVAGYGAPGQMEPRPIADFTGSIDALEATLESLYQASDAKQIVLTEARRGMRLAMDMSWRPDAQKAIVVISDSLDTGMPDVNRYVARDAFQGSQLTREILQKSRELGGVEIYFAPVRHYLFMDIRHQQPYDGLTWNHYRQTFTYPTGGQVLHYNNCDHCSWRHADLSMLAGSFARNPKTTVPAIRAKAGETVQLGYIDSSAGVIGSAPQGVSHEWFIDCEYGSVPSRTVPADLQYTFSKAQKCYGALLTRVNSSAWCNVCVEPDAYSPRSATPFEIEILPADYTPPPSPGPVRNLRKTVYPGHLTFRWDAPSNQDEVGELAYIVSDGDGHILGATAATELHIVDIPEGQQPAILVAAAGSGGTGQAVSSTGAETIIAPVEQHKEAGSTPAPDSPAMPAAEPERQHGITRQQAVRAPGNTGQAIELAAQPRLGTAFQGAVESVQTPAALPNLLALPSQQRVPQHAQRLAAAPAQPWTKLTVVAIPLAAAAALGFVVKYSTSISLSRWGK